MTTPNEKNLASGTIAESISASSTTILVYVGEGGATTIKGVWPTTPFYATIMPSNPNAGVANSLDSEIVLVTAVGNDQVGNTALTVTRGQRGTTTKAYTEGDIVTAGIYAEDAVLLEEDGTAESPSPWVTQDDIVMSSLNFGNYSTSETNTGFTWIDGKPIYKKTIEYSGGIASGNNSISHGISNLKIVVNKEIFGYRSSDTTTAMLPMWAQTNQIGNWTCNANTVQINSTFSWTDVIYITLYYTKTTD